MAVTDFFTPVSPSRDLLVGFGRAVSDCGLTASIHDVMVTLNKELNFSYVLNCPRTEFDILVLGHVFIGSFVSGFSLF